MYRNIKLLALFNFFTDFKFHSAVLIIYFAQVTGSYTLAMTLFSVVMVSSALFEMPTGIFSDLIGRKKTIILGAISATLGALFYAVGQTFWILFIGALFEGLSRSFYSGNNTALLHDSLESTGKKESYAHYLGKTSAMFQIALMLGAVTGSILAQWSFTLIMWLSVIPQVICVVISFFIINPAHFVKGKSDIFAHIKLSAFHLWNNKSLRLLSIGDILGFGIGESAFHFNAAFIRTIWPLWAVGFSKMISYSTAAASYWFSGKIIRKIGEYNILIIANIYTRLVYFISCALPTVFSPVLIASSSMFHGVTSVSSNTLMQKEYTHEQRATLGSMNSFLGSIFYGIFSPVLGMFADYYGPANALIIAQVCMISVIYINIKLKKMNKA